MKNEISVFITLLWVAGVFYTTFSWADSQGEDMSTAEVETMASEKLEQARLIEVPAVDYTRQAETTQLWALYKNLYESQGTVLFQGKKAARLGNLEIKNYRLEEINLSQPWKAKIKNQDIWTNKAWRLTITGGPFPVQDMPIVIWAGDTVLGYGQQNFDLSENLCCDFRQFGINRRHAYCHFIWHGWVPGSIT